MAWAVPWQYMGVQVSGDVGDLTIYTDRFGKKVAFPKSPPKEPPSNLQTIQRNNFRTAQAQWMALSSEDKNSLEDACRKLSMPLTGQNLHMHTTMTLDFDAYETIQKQSGISLPALP